EKGWTQDALGRKYNVDQTVISSVVRGKTWKDPSYGVKDFRHRAMRANTKLDEAAVAEIKAMLRAGKRQAEIAARYGVGRTAISRIGSGTRWGRPAVRRIPAPRVRASN